MMGSCNLWLPLAALLPLVRIAPTYCQHTEDYRLTFLVAIKSNGSGLVIRTHFPENRGSVSNSGASQWPDHELETQVRFIPGYSLSSECGDQYYRCRELLVVDDEPQFVHNRTDHSATVTASGESLGVVFVPLETGLLLLSFWYDSNTTTIQWNTSVVKSSNCSPTVFYAINGKFYMVCIGSHEEDVINVAVYEVWLNLSSAVFGFGGSALVKQLTSISIDTTSNSPTSLSNFVVVNSKIYTAIGSTIIALDVLDKTHTQYPELPGCPQVNKLVPTDDQPCMLVAYCIDRYICFDTVYGDWNGQQLFSNDGVPYLCPDNDYKATYFINGTLQLSLRDVLRSTINNVNISSGICFESRNITYFAYSDQQHNNVYVYDFTTHNHYPVSPYDCSNVHQDCPQLLYLENQYLIIRDSNQDMVLDATTNFSLLINISSGIADILAVLHGNVHTAITPSPPTIHSRSSATAITPNTIATTSTLTSTSKYTNSPSLSSSIIHSSITVTVTTASPDSSGLPRGNLVGIVLTVSVGLMVIIVILITIAIGPSIRRCWRNKRYSCNNMCRIARRRFRLRFSRTNQSAPTPLLAFDSTREEEDSESIEMESRAKQLGWKITKL